MNAKLSSTRLRKHLSVWIPVALATAATAAACGGDGGGGTTVPRELATFSISGVQPAGGPSWSPGETCAELPRDTDRTIAVEINATDLTLRPPKLCGSIFPCGHLRLSYSSDGVELSAISSARSVSVELPAGMEPGLTHRFEVEVLDDDDERVVETDGTELVDVVEVVLEAPGTCTGEDLDAGADVSTDAEIEAGMDAEVDADDMDAETDADDPDADMDAEADADDPDGDMDAETDADDPDADMDAEADADDPDGDMDADDPDAETDADDADADDDADATG